MCQLLCLKRLIGDDPAETLLPGDIVGVFDDDHVFGLQELNPEKFTIFPMPGEPSEKWQFLASEDWTPLSETVPPAVLAVPAFRTNARLMDTREIRRQRRYSAEIQNGYTVAIDNRET